MVEETPIAPVSDGSAEIAVSSVTTEPSIDAHDGEESPEQLTAFVPPVAPTFTHLEIKGDADLKVRVFGRTLFDKDTPFDVSIPLSGVGSFRHDFGPATIAFGLDGTSLSIAGLVEGFPVFHHSFDVSKYEAPIPFDFKALGDEAKGTITLIPA